MFTNVLTVFFLVVVVGLVVVYMFREGKVERLQQTELKQEIIASRTWPYVTGQIVTSIVEEVEYVAGSPNEGGEYSPRKGIRYSADYFPKIEYVYTVDGKQYDSSCVRFGSDIVFSIRDDAYEFVQRYKEGKLVNVYYDPEYPSDSVLER